MDWNFLLLNLFCPTINAVFKYTFKVLRKLFFLARRQKVQPRHGQDEGHVHHRGGRRKAHQHGSSGDFTIYLKNADMAMKLLERKYTTAIYFTLIVRNTC